MYNHSGHRIDITIHKLIIYIFYPIHIYKKIHIHTHTHTHTSQEIRKYFSRILYIKHTYIYMHMTYDVDTRRDSVFVLSDIIFFILTLYILVNIYIHIHICTHTHIYLHMLFPKPLSIFLRRKFSFLILGVGDV